MPTMQTPQTYCPSPHLPISMISSPPIYYTNTLYYLRCMRHYSPSHPPRPPPDHPAHASPNPLRLPQTPCLATSYPPYPPPACSPHSYADPTEPHSVPMPNPLSYPFGELEGVAAAPSTLSTPDSDAGLGLFGIRHKKSSYAKLKRLRHLFARKGDFFCSYHGPIRTIA